MKSLLSVAEAEQRIHAHMPSFGTERVALDAARGRALRQTVKAERDQPPFDRVMMDGIAIALGDGSRREFVLAGRQLAGMSGQALDDPSGCIEVTTGAMLPAGSNGSDAWPNLLGAIRALQAGLAPGVHLFFNGELLHGARASKLRSEAFDAFAVLPRPREGERAGRTAKEKASRKRSA